MLKTQLKDQKGFSLVELIVVIAIMVILIAMLVPNVVGYINKATIATEKSAAQTIYSSAQSYVSDCYAEGKKYGTGAQVPVSDVINAQMLEAGQVEKLNTITIKTDTSNESAVASVEFASSTGTGTITYSNGSAQLVK